MQIINTIRRYIEDNNLDAVLINSTNEFLEEYTPLCENERFALTKFSGSTGDAVVTAESVYLFVDGRYHIQADMEVNRDIVTVVKLQTGQTMISEMKKLLPKNAKLGVCSKKNSQKRVEKFAEVFDVFLYNNELVKTVKEEDCDSQVNLLENLCGTSESEKLKSIRAVLEESDAILITNCEEVSYLFNVRNFSKPYTSKVRARAIVTKNSARMYKDLAEYEQEILKIKGKIFIDKNSITAYDYNLVGERNVIMQENPLQLMKSIKTVAEINHYKEAFKKTDMAVAAIRDYIETNDNISEFDIAQKLEEYFKLFGAKSLSFKSIVAKDKNSALAHYSKCSRDEIIKDGSLILIDCGAYYEGGLATDITRVFVKGSPSELQKKVYTTVLKAFLNAFNFDIKENTNGYEIDSLAREIFVKNKIEGFEFNHGLGHGIGISVHEYPPNLSPSELAKVKLENNMCFTIEPGLYNKDYFGVRLENSCYMQDGKIHSFVKMNYENKLIDYSLLTEEEKTWLREFEVK